MDASEKRLPSGALAPTASPDKTSGIEGARSFSATHAARKNDEGRARQKRENEMGVVGQEVAGKQGSGGPAAAGAAGAWLVRYHRTCSGLLEMHAEFATRAG
jgi:hypothetical protein